jgi:hypothetical protein
MELGDEKPRESMMEEENKTEEAVVGTGAPAPDPSGGGEQQLPPEEKEESNNNTSSEATSEDDKSTNAAASAEATAPQVEDKSPESWASTSDSSDGDMEERGWVAADSPGGGESDEHKWTGGRPRARQARLVMRDARLQIPALESDTPTGRPRAMTPEQKATSERAMNVADSGLSRMRTSNLDSPPLRRAMDDSNVGRRLSLRDIDAANTKAAEKKARLGFGKRVKLATSSLQATPDKDCLVEDGILYFSDSSALSPCFVLPLTLAGYAWPTCLHYYLVRRPLKPAPFSSFSLAAHTKD